MFVERAQAIEEQKTIANLSIDLYIYIYIYMCVCVWIDFFVLFVCLITPSEGPAHGCLGDVQQDVVG